VNKRCSDRYCHTEYLAAPFTPHAVLLLTNKYIASSTAHWPRVIGPTPCYPINYDDFSLHYDRYRIFFRPLC